MSELQNAVHNSKKFHQTVTVEVDDIERAYESLMDGDAGASDHTDYVDTQGQDGRPLREVWGWDDETAEGKMEWRVHLLKRA